MPMLTSRFDEAFAYAHEVHASQVGKGNNSPHIGHLMGVASIVLDDGGSKDLRHLRNSASGGGPLVAELERIVKGAQREMGY